MSVCKLLSRIGQGTDEASAELSFGYGITNCPLTRFAVVLSALLHDTDHPGIPNSELIKQNAPVAAAYNNKSVAEQNSTDIGWGLLMQPQFVDLRRTIYCNEAEFRRFRQTIVMTIMATDIMDKELKSQRNVRWEKAFSTSQRALGQDDDASVRTDRKATIVIEHLIQASDVAHTMQHWHIYRKWNENFFLECYKAYLNGCGDKSPAETWYRGEMGFFDFYILPLARKLKDCGVFGVSSDEYLNYAVQNRREWEIKGQRIVEEMLEKARTKYGDKVEE